MSGNWRNAMHLQMLANLAEVCREQLRPRATGRMVARLEESFAKYVGAKHAIAMTNGTVTLQVAIEAMGWTAAHPDTPEAYFHVAVPPLTMSATTAAVVAARGTPYFVDVEPDTWILDEDLIGPVGVGVSLFGLGCEAADIDDAAQSLRQCGGARFTSYSFQSSKHISSGEGGMLVTNDDELAARARSFASLGYDLSASSRIDRMAIRDPDAIRHVRFGINARMNDVTAAVVLAQLEFADQILAERAACAEMYRQAHQGCSWLTPQHVPDGATHTWWCYPLLMARGIYADIKRWRLMSDVIVSHGGEKPYACWRLTFDEPAYKHLKPEGGCPVAESIQPRLLLFQTNDLTAAEKNAEALRRTIRELGG
jgi:perosamine synthetase